MASSTHPGSDTFEEWGAIVSELLENCGDWLGVFVHQYRGSLDDEKLSAVARRVPATLSIGEALRDLDEDELMYFDQAWLRAQA